MTGVRDAIIVGGGVNGLVTAAYLAKAGIKPLIVERTDRVGGCVRTGDLAPGFRCPTLAHAAALDPAVVSALGLERHGLQIVRPAAAACAPTKEGRALVLWRDTARSATAIRAWSAKDAERYPAFVESFANVSRVITGLLGTPAPSIDDPSAGDLIALLKTGRRFRALGKADAYRLIRWMPMAVADFVAEWFDSEPLRALIAAGGVIGAFLGPWSAGSAAQLLLLGATEAHPVASGWFAKGGAGAVADALAAAARQTGAEIRVDAEVARVDIEGGTATGVTLANGEQIRGRIVVSGVDPKRTLLGMIDPIELEPDFVRRVQNIRTQGTLAKVNYAVSALPRFASDLDADERRLALAGRVRLATHVDAIERAFDAAKYGRFAEEPCIELTIPSLVDQDLARDGGHVVSAYVQYAPCALRGASWDDERERLGDAATRTIEQYAPGFTASVVAREVITPADLERRYGLTGGHIFHGELALDQLFVTRPLLGWARHTTPIRSLFLCGSGTHPGTGVDGRSGMLAAAEIARTFKR